MNIYEIKGPGYAKQLSTDRKAKGENGFDQILNHAMDSVVHEKPAGDGVSPLRKVDFPLLRDRGHVDHPVLEYAYDILDLLEEYAEALNNPQMTLKGIEPIVTRIEQELKGLDMQYGDNVAKNDELAGIINEIVVRARVEAFKFQRGDYIG